MKKIFSLVMAMLIMASVSFAQNTNTTTKTEKKTTTQKTETSGPKLKKDGTPDKRYKENKEPVKHLKKDGTPDMRYKENKKAK